MGISCDIGVQLSNQTKAFFLRSVLLSIQFSVTRRYLLLMVFNVLLSFLMMHKPLFLFLMMQKTLFSILKQFILYLSFHKIQIEKVFNSGLLQEECHTCNSLYTLKIKIAHI